MPGTDPGVKAQLTGLISLLGRRDGEGSLLNFGGGDMTSARRTRRARMLSRFRD